MIQVIAVVVAYLAIGVILRLPAFMLLEYAWDIRDRNLPWREKLKFYFEGARDTNVGEKLFFILFWPMYICGCLLYGSLFLVVNSILSVGDKLKNFKGKWIP